MKFNVGITTPWNALFVQLQYTSRKKLKKLVDISLLENHDKMKGPFTEHSQYVVKINCFIIVYKAK